MRHEAAARRRSRHVALAILTAAAWSGISVAALHAVDPYADQVVSYVQGSGGNVAYGDALTAIGEPSRFTPHAGFPSVVSMVSSPFLNSQIVQLGAGGSLTVRFDEPVLDHPANPYGIDLLVFGNSFFNWDFAQSKFTSPASLFGDGMGRIEVSADGVDFIEVTGAMADQLFPTQGYLDAGPFDGTPGQQPTDFRKPVNPALTLADFDGLTFEQALALYDGSGGGTPVDITSTGLAGVSYVRITNLGGSPLEVDAFVAVPEPMTALLLIPALLAIGRRSPSTRF